MRWRKGERGCATTVVSSNCFSWQCHNNNAREENLFRVSRCEPHLAFCVCLCSIKVSRPTAPLRPPPLLLAFLNTPVSYQKSWYFPFCIISLACPFWWPPRKVCLAFLLCLCLYIYFSLSLSPSLTPFLSLYPSHHPTPSLLLCNLKPKSAKSFSCGFGSFQIPWPSLLPHSTCLCHLPPLPSLRRQSLAFSMVL